MTVNHWVAGSSPAGGAIRIVPRVLKSIDSPKSLTFSIQTLGFSPKSKQFQCHKTNSITVLFSLLYFFCQLPLLSQGNPTPESAVAEAEQVLFVTAKAGATTGHLDFYTLTDGEWVGVIEKIPVRLGPNGLLVGWEKREGDGHTPTGVFPIQRIIGKSKRKIRNLEYTEIQKSHYWNDNPKSKNYNQLTKQWEKGSISLWDSYIYELFVVIEHNTKPALPGMGSMIFLHVWNEDKPTSGCVGVSKEILEKIISMLDGDKNPTIILEFLN